MRPRRPRRQINGVLFLDKPTGLTSNAALQRIKHLLGAAKAGHTGTLDPLASGLLPLAFGEATKFSSSLLDADKEYVADLRLGIETDSGDAEGNPTHTAAVNFDPAHLPVVLDSFRGEIEQVPPMFSALKHQGRPLYEYARAGIELPRASRWVCIHTLELLEVRADDSLLRLRVRCSKGTYIRSLAIDIGRQLGCGAHLSALRRTAIANFHCQNAHTLASLEAAGLQHCLASLQAVDTLVQHLPLLALNEQMATAVSHGQIVHAGSLSAMGHGPIRLYGPKGFLGIGQHTTDGCVAPKRLCSTNNTHCEINN